MQIMVAVAIIQVEFLKTEVEKDSAGRAFRSRLAGPKPALNRVQRESVIYNIFQSGEREAS